MSRGDPKRSARRGETAWGAGRPRPPRRAKRRLEALRRLDLAADQQRPERVHLLDERLRDARADLADRDAVVPEIEDGVDAALELAALRGLRGQEDRRVDPLDGARQDVPAEVRLVLVHADAPAALLAS